jgi:hypothetical protein
MIAAQAVLYWLVPAVLWHRFGLSRREERRAQWPRIRSRILLVFIPVLAIDCLLFVDIVERGIWGFLPFFAGLHLLSLGYMQLARAAESPPGNETAASLFA